MKQRSEHYLLIGHSSVGEHVTICMLGSARRVCQRGDADRKTQVTADSGGRWRQLFHQRRLRTAQNHPVINYICGSECSYFVLSSTTLSP